MTEQTNTNRVCEKINDLLSGYVDNELTQQDSQRVTVHIQTCKQCQATLTELEQLQIAVKESEMPELEQEKIEALLNEPVSMLMQTIGWIAALSGIAIAIVYTLLAFYMATDMSTTEKLTLSLIWGGLIGVFLGVARQQLIARKTDKYKGVKL
jgi:anti-sigma factor RsiW